ncbi:MAG TPA: hypothetical protein VHW92_02590 [Mycobacteriales bacterium]|jgi:hypothetical protein|nr:hypothetical protein [Mycobacteriales bacterium]
MAATVLASGALGVGIAAALAGGGSGHAASSAGRYGALPSFLPTPSVRTDAIVTGTVRHPGLTSQGDAVHAVLPNGRFVRVTVSGPETPGEGLPFQADADTATWTVTLSDASKPVPISTKAFSAIDSLGKIYRPQLVPGQPRPPAVLRPGHTARFELRVVMRVGEGDMRWAPLHNDLLATWDFVVEND